MIVVREQPPMFEEIAAVFPMARGDKVMFSWGEKIYIPGSGYLTPALEAHESVHGLRQGGSEAAIRAWWRRYLEEPAFRLGEEAIAHRAEYEKFCGLVKDRNARARELHAIAQRLCSPLYRCVITYQQARHAIAATY